MARRIQAYKPAARVAYTNEGDCNDVCRIVYTLTDLAESVLKDIDFIVAEKKCLRTPF
jgi:hypothetical protein